MAQQLAEILAQLDPVYNPQKQVVNQQLAALPGQQQAEQSGLDQAKTNAFSDITEGANSRGLVYSGMPIAEQAKYIGEKYLPATANLKSTFANKGFQLQGTLAQLEADKMKQAQGVYSDEVKAEQDAAAKKYAADQAAQAQIRSAQISASSRASAKEPSAADKTIAARGQLNSDLAAAFNGYKTRPSFYTERTIIPQLQQAYPEFTQDEIAKAVYGYRNNLGYG